MRCADKAQLFSVSASYTEACVTKIREAFPDRATDEERKEPLAWRMVSFLSLSRISPHGHQHAYIHVHITYDLVMK